MFDTANQGNAKLINPGEDKPCELAIESLDAVAGGVHVTRKIDAASPNLFVACATGEHLK
ncbi:type VI secretion system tube protein Hcp [Bradyrhizobium jicamae]|uniref:type VI secretion system tube protein Hcp n=1 Tax=Bradyrhizobium jicamae TaxID=280332 RepID=UPI001BA808BD|nr:type VI secretion system tube protein Hcp [Bradyrhizobium jicamae]MBR0751554.1 type VI secretion system tube protein Hcp [Bradyrhizobium jicamae]